MGGKIWVENQVDGGICFMVVFFFECILLLVMEVDIVLFIYLLINDDGV